MAGALALLTLVTSLAIRASVSIPPPPLKTSPSVTSAILARGPAADRALFALQKQPGGRRENSSDVRAGTRRALVQ